METNLIDRFIEDAGSALRWYWGHGCDRSDPMTVVSKETGEQYTIYSVAPHWPKEEE